MPDHAAIVQAVAALFEGQVGVGVTDPRSAHPDLMPGEGAHLSRALPARIREFAAGRAAARLAMQAIGFPPAAVLAASDRSPRWPAGLRGSISHSKTLCVAVVTHGPQAIGIDIEEATPLDPALLGEILKGEDLPTDTAALRQAKLIFCAKEAAFKAQFPLSAQLFGYDGMDIAFDQGEGRFTARFTSPVRPFATGTVLQGRHSLLAEHFVTAVSIDISGFEGC